MNKKVFFVAGTSYSGSTLLDLILANDENAVSVGEIEALYHPVKQHHLEKIKELRSDELWSRKLREGVGNLYNDLHDTLGVETIVDSSKNPAWIRFHIERLPNEVEWHVILVHKTLADLKHSFEKRGRYSWLRVYKNYHSLLFRNVETFHAIEYKEIPTQSNKFFSLLKDLGVYHNNSRLNFWEQKRTNFFGNNNTNRSFSFDQENKKLVYTSYDSEEVCKFINREIERDSKLRSIHSYLNSKNGLERSPVFYGILTNYYFRRMLRKVRMSVNYVRSWLV